ncbi:hypothetical protein [Runella sp. CRIBMP]|uniref:hypothetical protein n=1 Tax=Runella sp. CRIBMP TaxID=2683261 RepID=UPI001980171D|nr:hypothetical protein [Runella sp. CRIBMP]
MFSVAQTGISEILFSHLLTALLSRSEAVEKMIAASFLNETTKRNYWQAYQGRLKQLGKE